MILSKSMIHNMGNRLLFRSNFQQKGNVCLLTSYGFIIEYYSNLSGMKMSSSFFPDLFKGYLHGIAQCISNLLTPTLEKELEQRFADRYQGYRAVLDGTIVIDVLSREELEELAFKVFHFFCQDVCSIVKNRAGGIHGFEHIHCINCYAHNSATHSIGKVVLPSNYVMGDVSIASNQGIPIDEIKVFLKKDEHSLALLLFQSAPGGNYHSVVCGYDKDGFYFRDPNCKKPTKTTYNGLTLDKLTCFEYIPISYLGQI